jgi:3-deoxy-manno-octulosonate cytidylyltransferase (CMP-KDO synthetase)
VHLKVLGVIPVRLESTRLPEKALREIHGKPMVQWVYEGAKQSERLSEVLVATDSEKIRDLCESKGIPVILTGEHPSGSDRLYEVLTRTEAEVYVNIQVDEPTVLAEHLDVLLAPFTSSEIEVTTLKVEIDRMAAADPNTVKVVTDSEGWAMYFSRHPIPFQRSEESPKYYKHIGIYAYTRASLKTFNSLPQAKLELAERLEQLRFLENGIRIFVAETLTDTIGVDTEEDLEAAARILSQTGRIQS